MIRPEPGDPKRGSRSPSSGDQVWRRPVATRGSTPPLDTDRSSPSAGRSLSPLGGEAVVQALEPNSPALLPGHLWALCAEGRQARAPRKRRRAGGLRARPPGLRRTPCLDGVPAARREFEEIPTVALAKAQRGLGETGRRPVDGGKVVPERVRHMVDQLAAEGGQDAVASAHLFHKRSVPSPRTCAPRSSTASKAMR